MPPYKGMKKRRRKENAMTLREVPVRTTVSVVKIHGEDVVPIHKSPDVVLQIENTLLASKEFGLISF